MVQKKISHKPPRWDQDNSIYFLTFCTFDRRHYLHRGKIPEMIVENLTFYSKRLKQLIAYTVMPDHVHVMVYVETVAQLSGFLRDFKKRTSKEIKRLLDIDVPHIWQQGTMDHCIRLTPENQDYINHLHYIFYNSVKHLGIVPKSFAFHNFTEAVGKGWIAEDFCAAPPEFPAVFESYEKNQHGDVESESD